MLSDLKIKQAKPTEKRYVILDADGLYIEVMPSGSKYWRYRYKRDGKEHKVSLGEYPLFSLKEAREKRDAVKKRIAEGKPIKDAPKAAITSFASVALEWVTKHEERSKSAKEKSNVRARLNNHIIPFIGEKDIATLEPLDILPLMQRLEALGTIETAHRVQQLCSQIFRYAVVTGRAKRDPTADLRGAIMPVPKRHHAAVTEPKQVGQLMRAIDAYPGITVRYAMQLTALTFVRSAELRHVEWGEVDLEKAEWRIPAEKMKMKRTHIVPLSTQAIAIFEKLKLITGHEKYVFMSLRSSDGTRPLSDAAILVALRRIGYSKDEMTTHGFRTMASTLLNELGWNRDAIERQLAHSDRDAVRAAYNYADYLIERRKMMQAWADYLDELRAAQ